MDALSEDKLKEIIQEILKTGYVIPSKHARERMPERNYTMADIRHILKNGNLVNTEKYNDQHRYTFRGNDLEDDPGEVVIAIEGSKLIIITVIGGVQ